METNVVASAAFRITQSSRLFFPLTRQDGEPRRQRNGFFSYVSKSTPPIEGFFFHEFLSMSLCTPCQTQLFRAPGTPRTMTQAHNFVTAQRFWIHWRATVELPSPATLCVHPVQIVVTDNLLVQLESVNVEDVVGLPCLRGFFAPFWQQVRVQAVAEPCTSSCIQMIVFSPTFTLTVPLSRHLAFARFVSFLTSRKSQGWRALFVVSSTYLPLDQYFAVITGTFPTAKPCATKRQQTKHLRVSRRHGYWGWIDPSCNPDKDGLLPMSYLQNMDLVQLTRRWVHPESLVHAEFLPTEGNYEPFTKIGTKHSAPLVIAHKSPFDSFDTDHVEVQTNKIRRWLLHVHDRHKSLIELLVAMLRRCPSIKTANVIENQTRIESGALLVLTTNARLSEHDLVADILDQISCGYTQSLEYWRCLQTMAKSLVRRRDEKPQHEPSFDAPNGTTVTLKAWKASRPHVDEDWCSKLHLLLDFQQKESEAFAREWWHTYKKILYEELPSLAFGTCQLLFEKPKTPLMAERALQQVQNLVLRSTSLRARYLLFPETCPCNKNGFPDRSRPVTHTTKDNFGCRRCRVWGTYQNHCDPLPSIQKTPLCDIAPIRAVTIRHRDLQLLDPTLADDPISALPQTKKDRPMLDTPFLLGSKSGVMCHLLPGESLDYWLPIRKGIPGKHASFKATTTIRTTPHFHVHVSEACDRFSSDELRHVAVSCPYGVFDLEDLANGLRVFDAERCIGCGQCQTVARKIQQRHPRRKYRCEAIEVAPNTRKLTIVIESTGAQPPNFWLDHMGLILATKLRSLCEYLHWAQWNNALWNHQYSHWKETTLPS